MTDIFTRKNIASSIFFRVVLDFCKNSVIIISQNTSEVKSVFRLIMLKRKILSKLTEWKNSRPEKCLIVEGARQIGKTFIIREFAKENYESQIELNFIENPSLSDIFKGALDSESVLTAVTLYVPDSKIIPGNTLLFIDEIQECSEAITALKFLAADSRIDVICSGSALGMSYKPQTSYPVGSVEYLKMTALDFEEFLWALNVDENIIFSLKKLFDDKDCKSKVPFAVHEKMNSLLRQYLVLGGMPEVVQNFVDNKDYRSADTIQRRLYKDYLYDIARYAKPDIKIKAERCYKSIPLQLTKENHKFQYGVVEHKATSSKYESSVDWLVNAHIAVSVNNLRATEYPLKAFSVEENFRIYPTDISFLICTYGYEIKSALLNDKKIEERPDDIILSTAKGGIYEALAADMLYKSGHENLNFYRSEKGTPEIEFFVENEDGVIPVEIKAGRTGTKSLNTVLENDNIKYGYKFASQNIGKSGKKITMPLYMLMFL